jgi:energy-converting hydrogenase A subunit M
MKRNLVAAALMAAVSLAALHQLAPAGESAKTANPRVDEATIALLRLMDTDKNGKVSKKEFMDFMEAEFDRLDKDKNGELDPAELAGLRIAPRHPGGSGSK